MVGAASYLLRGRRPETARRLGAAFGDLWHRLDGSRRRIAAHNLRRALPDLPEARRAAIARSAFRHFGTVGVDLLRFPSYRPEDAVRLASVAGWEHLESAHRKGRGVIVFSAHYGHWELVALLQGFAGIPMDMVTRPMDNEALEARLARARVTSGNRVIHKRSAVRGVLRALGAGRSVAIVIDQNFREENRVFVDFFGRPAATTPFLGVVALRTGAPVIPVFSWPADDGRYRIEYHPEVEVVPTGDRAEDALQLTRACTRSIEAQVRSRPEYWFWMHQRWRTRPEDEADGSRVDLAGAAAAGKAGG